MRSLRVGATLDDEVDGTGVVAARGALAWLAADAAR